MNFAWRPDYIIVEEGASALSASGPLTTKHVQECIWVLIFRARSQMGWYELTSQQIHCPYSTFYEGECPFTLMFEQKLSP